MQIQHGTTTTADGVRLAWRECGSGPPLVMIPGWSQTAAQFRHQFAALGEHYRVIGVDMRGHGDSDTPDHGYRIPRLAADLRAVITDLALKPVSLLGHSMGCSVIWSYLDVYGDDDIDRLVLVDQSPALLRGPGESDSEAQERGALFSFESLAATCDALRGPNATEATRDMIENMLTAAMSAADRAWMLECNLTLPRQHAATLLFNHCCQDWRDVIARILRPTLVVGGRASLIPWQSQAWIQQQVPGAELALFEADEGGQHFMFIEAAERFNQVVSDFLG